MTWNDALTRLNTATQRVFGQSAVYTPVGGPAQAAAVSVIVERAPAQIGLGGGFHDLPPSGASEWTIEVRAADIASGAVAKGDAFAIAGVGTFVVTEAPRPDVMNAVWTCPARKTA